MASWGCNRSLQDRDESFEGPGGDSPPTGFTSFVHTVPATLCPLVGRGGLGHEGWDFPTAESDRLFRCWRPTYCML